MTTVSTPSDAIGSRSTVELIPIQTPTVEYAQLRRSPTPQRDDETLR